MKLETKAETKTKRDVDQSHEIVIIVVVAEIETVDVVRVVTDERAVVRRSDVAVVVEIVIAQLIRRIVATIAIASALALDPDRGIVSIVTDTAEAARNGMEIMAWTIDHIRNLHSISRLTVIPDVIASHARLIKRPTSS